MKLETATRLDLLAAQREAQLITEIDRHNASLSQIAQQQLVLAAYRDRLALSWQAGVVVDAAFARRGAKFVDASRKADGQIDQFAEQARRQLDAAVQKLAQVRGRRRILEEMLRAAGRAAAQMADTRAALAQPWIGRTGGENG